MQSSSFTSHHHRLIPDNDETFSGTPESSHQPTQSDNQSTVSQTLTRPKSYSVSGPCSGEEINMTTSTEKSIWQPQSMHFPPPLPMPPTSSSLMDRVNSVGLPHNFPYPLPPFPHPASLMMGGAESMKNARFSPPFTQFLNPMYPRPFEPSFPNYILGGPPNRKHHPLSKGANPFFHIPNPNFRPELFLPPPKLPKPEIDEGVRPGPDKRGNINVNLFKRGTVVKVAGGGLKRVEELTAGDFELLGDQPSQHRLEDCRVVRIEENHVEGTARFEFMLGAERKQLRLIELAVTQPFFVADKGWASCDPQRTMERFGLPCRRLEVGDVCITLVPKRAGPAPSTSATVPQDFGLDMSTKQRTNSRSSQGRNFHRSPDHNGD